MNLDSTLAVTNTCPKDGVHLYSRPDRDPREPDLAATRESAATDRRY